MLLQLCVLFIGMGFVLRAAAAPPTITAVPNQTVVIDRPTDAIQLYVADASGRNERRLTGFNDKLVSEVAFSDAERLTFASIGGMEIESSLPLACSRSPSSLTNASHSGCVWGHVAFPSANAKPS